MTNKTSLSITRRQTLKFGGAALSASLFAPAVIRSAWAAEEPITLLTWETYDEPEWIAEWQAANGTEIKPVIISSLDEVFAQLQSGAVKPDVIYSEASTAGRLKKAGQITPFDISKVPNISNILPGLNWREPLTVDGALMGIPLHWGTQPLQYNADAIKSAPTSWAALWDKTYQGKVTIFDDATVTIPMVALYVGAKNPFNLTEDEFTLVASALRELRAQVRVVTPRLRRCRKRVCLGRGDSRLLPQCDRRQHPEEEGAQREIFAAEGRHARLDRRDLYHPERTA